MFKGTITAVVTPFKEGSSTVPEVDMAAYESLLEWQLSCGVEGIVVCGTTGESATLTNEEKLALVKRTCEVVNSRVPVIAGTGSYATAATVEMTREVKKLGVDAALVVSPYYNKPTQRGLYSHFEQVAKEGGLPVVVYNIPGRTAVSIEMDTFRKLAALDGIVAVKQAVDSASELLELIRVVDGKVSVLAGDDALTFFTMAAGGKGVISASASVIPEEMRAITSAAAAGDYEKARDAQFAALPLISVLFRETNPAPAKAALKLLGRIPSDIVRLPLVSASDETKSKIQETIVNR